MFSSIFALFSLWTKAFTCHHYEHCFSCAVRTRILPLHPQAVTQMSRITRAVTPCDIHHHTQSIYRIRLLYIHLILKPVERPVLVLTGFLAVFLILKYQKDQDRSVSDPAKTKTAVRSLFISV